MAPLLHEVTFNETELIIRLILAFVFGAVLGFEREAKGRPAGLRTHMLVCMASALITMMSKYAFPYSEDSRVAAGIFTGIGFIGAGTIIVSENSIRGLTTAASIWAVAAIGLTTGCGFYMLAAVTTVLSLLTLELDEIIMRIFHFSIKERVHQLRSLLTKKEELNE